MDIMKKRVVITGMGAVTPLGNNAADFWQGIKSGSCGIDIVGRFDTTDFTCKVAGEVKNFNAEDFIDKKEARRMDRYTHYGMAAAKMAIGDSGINLEKTDLCRVGVITGVGVGGMETLEEQHNTLLSKGVSRVSPFFIPMMIPNILGGHIAIMTGARGTNFVVVSACASGTNALGEAFRMIRDGMLDVVIAGGAEAAITPLSFAGFCSMKAMSSNPDPGSASRPFDKNRDGFVMGEGSGIVILEELSAAQARGAHIYAEIAGYGSSNDAYHITAPVPGGAGGALAMRNALSDAGISPQSIDYINAHGTSTSFNDKFETMAIKEVFGGHAYKLKVSSTKSMTGHLLGAAGAAEAIICAKAIEDSFIPPTIAYSEADEECDLNYVPNTGVNENINYALSNSFGFGGHNATIILKKF